MPRTDKTGTGCDLAALAPVIRAAKHVAIRYRRLTGKPLGVTSEVAEFEAARLMNVSLCVARQAGYDAIGKRNGTPLRIQIKGRCVLESCKPGQRVPRIDFRHPWHVVWLVLLDSKLNPTAIWEARRTALRKALIAPGSVARNERGQLSIQAFRKRGRRIWPT